MPDSYCPIPAGETFVCPGEDCSKCEGFSTMFGGLKVRITSLEAVKADLLEMLDELSDKIADWHSECDAYCTKDMKWWEDEINRTLLRYDRAGKEASDAD